LSCKQNLKVENKNINIIQITLFTDPLVLKMRLGGSLQRRQPIGNISLEEKKKEKKKKGKEIDIDYFLWFALKLTI
jgi:hypothetical protein